MAADTPRARPPRRSIHTDDANTQQLGRSFAAELTPTLMGQVQNRDVVLPLVQALWRGLAGIRPTSCGTVKRFGPSETIVDWPTRPQEPMFNTEIMRADPARRESMGNAPLARGEYVMLAVGEERADARKINLTTLNGVAQTGLITALVRALQTHRQDPVIVEHAACALGRCAFAGASEGGQARSIELATAGGTAILSQLLVEHVGQGNTTAVSGLLQALSSAMSGADVGMPMTQGGADRPPPPPRCLCAADPPAARRPEGHSPADWRRQLADAGGHLAVGGHANAVQRDGGAGQLGQRVGVVRCVTDPWGASLRRSLTLSPSLPQRTASSRCGPRARAWRPGSWASSRGICTSRPSWRLPRWPWSTWAGVCGLDTASPLSFSLPP